MSRERETQEPQNRELWGAERAAQEQDDRAALEQRILDNAHDEAGEDDDTAGQAELFPARRYRRQTYRFPRTPAAVRLEAQCRIDETPENVAQFRRMLEKVQTRLRIMRVPEAVIVRSLRWYLVQHQYAFLHAFAQLDVDEYGGRVITEAMVLEVLRNIWPVRGAAPEGAAGRPARSDSRVAS